MVIVFCFFQKFVFWFNFLVLRCTICVQNGWLLAGSSCFLSAGRRSMYTEVVEDQIVVARGWLGNSIACEVGLGVGFLVSDRVSQAFVLFAFGEGRALVAKVEVLGVGGQSF